MKTLSIPKMGESVSEALIIQWLKKEGDPIQRDESYIEVSTDKVDSEIPSPYKCILKKIIAKEGTTVKVGQAIAEIEIIGNIEETDNVEIIPSVEISKVPINKSNLDTKNRSEKTSHKLSPLVKKLLSKNNISYSEIEPITGTGFEGRITKDDVHSFIHNRSHFEENKLINTSEPLLLDSKPSIVLEEGDQHILFDRMRGLIAKYMLESISKSAHCTSFSEVDVTNLVNWRDQIKDDFLKKHSSKITYTHLFMYLVKEALSAFPKINAHSTQDGYILKSSINLGFATALPDGNLIVPNIKGIEKLALPEIVASVQKIGSEAKNNLLKPDDIKNGTFTISNTGIFGSLMGTPIINQPQVAIMSLGEIIKTPAVVEINGHDIIAIRKKMILSLSYDHRIIDGAYAASFLKFYKGKIESFSGIEY